MKYAALADSVSHEQRPAGRLTVACDDMGPTATSPVGPGGLSRPACMSTMPPRRLGAAAAVADLPMRIDEKWVALNTEKKPSRWAALYIGTPSMANMLCELSLPCMCSPASYSPPVCMPGSIWA